MTKRALVDHPNSTRVYQVVDTGSDFSVSSPLSFVDCGDSVTTQYTYNGSIFTAPTIDYDALREAVKINNSAEYEELRRIGAVYGLSRFRILSDDIDRWLSLYTLAINAEAGGYVWPADIVVTSIEGTEIPLETSAEALLFGNAVILWFYRLSTVYQEQEMTIDALADDSVTINGFDYETPYDSYR
jgi:hypothetical protein